MLDEKNKNHSVSDSFFWEIPGDVPGRRSQPDPFQSVRSTPDPDYQLPAHVSTEIQQSHRVANVTEPLTATDSNDSVNQSQPKRFRMFPVFIVLLAMLFLAGTGYKYLFSLEDNDVAMSTMKAQLTDRSVAVTKNTINVQSKIFELILGKKDSTPQSQLRIITHVVVKGDTLWDIAETYVKDPFRYPELAELSEINKPDLIYPYEIVRIQIYE
jgi:nucleoid-associated protein YgaU